MASGAFGALIVCIALIAAVETNMLPALDRELRWFSDASNDFITRTLTPAKAQPGPVDTEAAANVDEDLDFRIAAQRKTADDWQAFLAAHPHGTHAPAAQDELARLTGASETIPQAQAPASPAPRFAPVVEVANQPPREPDYFAALERPRPPETKIVETTIVKWRERTRYVTRWRYERPRYVWRQPSPFSLSWLGGANRRAWHGRYQASKGRAGRQP